MNWIQLQGVWINLDNVSMIRQDIVESSITIVLNDGSEYCYAHKRKDFDATVDYLRERLSETTKKLA